MGNVGPFGNGMGMSGGGFAADRGLAMSGGLFGGMDGMGSADGYGVVSLQKHRDPEFTMQTEDFPALPGAPGMGGGKGQGGLGAGAGFAPGANRPPAQRAGGGGAGFPGLGGAPKPGGEGYPARTVPRTARRARRARTARGSAARGARATPPATLSSRAAAPRTPPVDRFGLLGLLGVIRMSDPDVTTLALGTDLTTLGLNLNSPEPLYKTFGSPWSDAPPRHESSFCSPRATRCARGGWTKAPSPSSSRRRCFTSSTARPVRRRSSSPRTSS